MKMKRNKQPKTFLETKLIINIYLLLLLIIGMSCNFVAVTNNGGKMPVYSSGEFNSVESPETHFVYYDSSEVKYHYLVDIIPIPFDYMVSVGDVIMFTSLIGLILINIFYRKK